MARRDNSTCYEKMLRNFMTEADPFYTILQWLTEKVMAVEAKAKVGTANGLCKVHFMINILVHVSRRDKDIHCEKFEKYLDPANP